MGLLPTALEGILLVAQPAGEVLLSGFEVFEGLLGMSVFVAFLEDFGFIGLGEAVAAFIAEGGVAEGAAGVLVGGVEEVQLVPEVLPFCFEAGKGVGDGVGLGG